MQPDDYKSIDLYLQDELLPEELTAFRERLQMDEALAAELALRQDMRRYLRGQAQRPVLDAELARLGQQHFGPEAKKRTLPTRSRWLAIAAAILLGVLAWLLLPKQEVTLYAEYAQHPSLALAERGMAEESQLAAQASTVFEQGDYTAAVPLLEQLLAARPKDRQLQLALGISYLETDQLPAAESLFTEIAESQSAAQPYGQWYLALSALKTGDNAKAKLLLEGVDEAEPTLWKKAQQLLSVLD